MPIQREGRKNDQPDSWKRSTEKVTLYLCQRDYETDPETEYHSSIGGGKKRGGGEIGEITQSKRRLQEGMKAQMHHLVVRREREPSD